MPVFTGWKPVPLEPGRKMFDPTYIDCFSGIDAPYQRIDARVKLAVSLTFIVVMTITVTSYPLRVVPFAFYVAMLAIASKLSPKVLLKRTLPAVPFFLFASLVLGFSKGSQAASAAFLKALFSVLSIIILVSTTRFSDLLKGLEGLKVPPIIVSMTAFVYRYLFIIADEYGHIKIARESRNFGGNKRWQWKAIGHSVGTLFLHSYERGDRIYSAMVARGYDGNIRTIGTQKIGTVDIIFAVASVSYLLLAGIIMP